MTGLRVLRRLHSGLGQAGRRLPLLIGSRLAEQVVLGAVAVLLAWRLGPSSFAPVSALLILNSAAVTLSDYGLGLAVLRRASGTEIARRSLERMRVVNACVAVAAVVAGSALRGDVGLVVAAGGVVWAASAEAFVRKAGAISLGNAHAAARAETAGALLLAIPVFAFASGGAALGVVAASLVAKHLSEVVLLPHSLHVFTRTGRSPGAGALFVTQALAFGIANVDYLLVGLLLGAEWFSVYTLGFRIAVVAPSIVAYTANRTALADLGAASDEGTREVTYRSYVRLLFGLGVAAGLAAAVAGVVCAVLFGDEWVGIAPTVVLLGVATPWRMILGQAGTLVLATDGAWRLARWEIARLVATVVVLALAAMAGYWMFVAAGSALTILSAAMLHDLAVRHAASRPWRPLWRLSGFASGVLLVAGAFAAAL